MQKKYDSVHRYENLIDISNIKKCGECKKKIEELSKKDEKDESRA